MMDKIPKPSNSEGIIHLNKKLDSDSFENMSSKAIIMLFYDAKESEKFDDLTFPYNKFQTLRHYHAHESNVYTETFNQINPFSSNSVRRSCHWRAP
jgi:hypothetical protein